MVVTTLALGVVGAVSAEDLGNLNNANSNEIKNVENEININNGYSAIGVSEVNLIQENGNFINNTTVNPVLNSENDGIQEKQFVNDDYSLINSVNMVNDTIENGTIYSNEKILLTQIKLDSANNGTIIEESTTMTPLGNDYVNGDIIKSIKGTSIESENDDIDYAVSNDGLNNNRNYIENINNLKNNNIANINAMDSTLKLNIKHTINRGEPITGKVTVTGNNRGLDGEVDVTVNNETVAIPVHNGTGDINIPISLAVGVYSVTATYHGDDSYKSSANIAQITIEPTIHIEAPNITYGDVEIITIRLSEQLNGTAYVTLNIGLPDQVTIINGVGTLPLTNLAAGIYRVSVDYSTPDFGITNTTSFTVAKANIDMNIMLNNMKYGENLTGEIFLSRNGQPINGMITLSVDDIDRNYNLNAVNGRVNVNLNIYYPKNQSLKITDDEESSYLPVGIHVATIKYNADNMNLNDVIETSEFMVEKAQAYMSMDVIQNNNDVTLIINLPENINNIVDIFVNNKYYSVEVINGVGVLTLSSLRAGTYDVYATFDGDNNYYGNETTAIFTVSAENDNNGTSMTTNGTDDENVLLDNADNATGNPITLLLLVLMLPMVRRVIKK